MAQRLQTKADLISILSKMPRKYLGDGIHKSMKVEALLAVLKANRECRTFDIDLNSIPKHQQFADRPVIYIGYQRIDFLSALHTYLDEIGVYLDDYPVKSRTTHSTTTLTVELLCTIDEFEKIKTKFEQNVI
jgi:hypothetical protein